MVLRRIDRLMLLVGICGLMGGCPTYAPQSLGAPAEASAPVADAKQPVPPVEVSPGDRVSDEAGADVTGLDPGMETHVSPSGIMWVPPIDGGASVLSLRDPFGTVSQFQYAAGESPYLDAGALADGRYVYEITVEPALDINTAAAMNEAADDPENRELIVQALVDNGQINSVPLGQSGSFMIADGSLIPGDSLAKGSGGGFDQDGGISNKDLVTADDHIIQGSACIGFDCVNNENFGFDTIRLKENNTRIRFDDTSNSGTFPSTDWQLTANDSNNGGLNRFSIEDTTAGRVPFTIEGAAPSHSLYVDDIGRIGVGTSTPAVEMHVNDGDSPALRLEQDGSSGFTAQTWDVAGNETNFFVRDVTNASRIPFKIRPGAPTNSLFVDADGDIGLGTASPSASLDVRSGSASVGLFKSTSRNAALSLESTDDMGAPRFNLTGGLLNWSMGIRETTGNFVISNAPDLGTSVNEAISIDRENLNVSLGRSIAVKRYVDWGVGTAFVGRLSPTPENNAAVIAGVSKNLEFWTGPASDRANRMTVTSAGNVNVLGNLTVNGTLSNPSDRNIKDAIEDIDPKAVLEKVVDMPISTWRYKKEEEGVRHLGPMAQDFMAAFGLGVDEHYITSIDADGVSLAAIQGLNQKLEEKDAIIAEQSKALEALAARVEALEKAAQ